MKTKKTLRILSYVAGGLGLILLILYTGGFLTPNKIVPGRLKPAHREPLQPRMTATASVQAIEEFYEAVGTVRPRTETNIEAQITARILEILVRPGDQVSQGKLLITLDGREFQARRDQARQGLMSVEARKEQARQAVVAAQAVYTQAESEFRRVKRFFESEAATSRDLEQAESAHLQAKAGLQRAEDALREADAGVKRALKIVEESKIALGYTRIVAPKQGEVVKRLAEPGDLAWPGKTLVVLQTRGELRFEALVREGLIHRVSPGATLQVVINALDKTFTTTVEEVVPSADPVTRTFLVKAGLPSEQGLFPGMFGRLLVPMGEKDVVVVPKAAITRVGQLEMVTTKSNGKWERIYVKTGKTVSDDLVEILSGLKGNEVLALKGETDAR